jgi:leucyl-tRNA synthetase
MSKSLGNVINPIDMIEKYSADSLRICLMSLASPDKDSIWSDKNLESCYKFINKVYEYFNKVKISKSQEKSEPNVGYLTCDNLQEAGAGEFFGSIIQFYSTLYSHN